MATEAIALCRVSTVKQGIEGTSLEAQEQRVQEAAVYLDTTIVKYWNITASSRKGKNYQRKDLQEMLVYAKANKRVKYIIVDEPDRFMRDFKMYFFWQVRFMEEAGAKLVYAKKPHLIDDNPMSLMEEMLDVFRAEASNHERITKTTSNMQARVKLGYYPGKTKVGYRRAEIPGLHVPSEPEWSMIRGALLDLLDGVPLKEVVVRLNLKGYRTSNGNKIDTFNFKRIAIDPYYAGIIAMSNWEVNNHGLHKPMITRAQHEQLLGIIKGVKYKPRKKFSSDFCLSNLIECTDCLENDNVKYPRLVGYNHSNGKPGDKRKHYKRYKCRGCGVSILRDELHEKISAELLNLFISNEMKEAFLGALRKVWERNESEYVSRFKALEKRRESLIDSKKAVILNQVKDEISKDDAQLVLADLNKEIHEIEQEIDSVQDREKDLVEFVSFSLDAIENMKSSFWELDAEHLGWCKQLLFPGGLSVSRDKKVYTPEVSALYRLMSNQKDPVGSSGSNMVGDIGFEPITSTTSMWRSSQMS